MATTPKYGLPQLDAAAEDINDFPAKFNAAMTDVDGLLSPPLTGTRPAAGQFGRLHMSSSGVLSFDISSDWVDINAPFMSPREATLRANMSIAALCPVTTNMPVGTRFKATASLSAKKAVAGQFFYQAQLRLNGVSLWDTGPMGFDVAQYDIVAVDRSVLITASTATQNWDINVYALNGGTGSYELQSGGGASLIVEQVPA